MRFLPVILMSGLFVACPGALAGESEWKAHFVAGLNAKQNGDFAAAETRFGAALKEAEGFGDAPLDQRRLSATLVELGVAFLMRERPGDAEPVTRRALAILEKLDGESQDVAAVVSNLGGILKVQSRYDEAETQFKRALAISEKAGPRSPGLILALNNMGELHLNRKRHAEAEPFFRRALATAEEAGHDSVFALEGLAKVSRAQGRNEEAERLEQRAREARKARRVR